MATRAQPAPESAQESPLDASAENTRRTRRGMARGNSGNGRVMAIQMGAGSAQGPRTRLEDAAFASLHSGVGTVHGRQIGLAGVFDGVGGNRGGHRASASAARAASSYLLAWVSDRLGLATHPAQLATAIQESLREASDAVWVEGMVDPGLDGAATTAVIAVLHDWRVTIGWAGDSRAYLIRGGDAERLTCDHTKARALLDAGQISWADLSTHPEAGVLTRWLGGAHPPPIDTRSVELRPGDAVALVTDGVYGVLEDHQIASIMARAAGAQEAADELVNQSLRWGTSDNATAVVCRVGRDDTSIRGALGQSLAPPKEVRA